MKKAILLLLFSVISVAVRAQDISLVSGWKFSPGDAVEWSAPGFNDQNWQSVDISKTWEQQGHEGLDGFGWYRNHVVIPASLKQGSFLKDSLRFQMGYGDDSYAVYLNGQLIGKNYNIDPKTGFYSRIKIVIPANNPAILWDKDNVIAIRVFDTGGAGGVYGDPAEFKLGMVDIIDDVWIDKGADFSYADKNSLTKSVIIETNSNYTYKGKLDFSATDPATGIVIYQSTHDAGLAKGKPFTYTFTIGGLKAQSYKLTYTFSDSRSAKKVITTEGTPYILTPYVSARPKINGPNVFGAHPNNPFLYKIPATGQKPLVFKADSLPEGLTLDAATGIITGVVNATGNYHVLFTVTNKLGFITKKFTIKVGDVIGLTPALGWNSWNAFGLSVTDAKVRVAAKTISDKLSAHGWSYVNIDDGWEAEHRASDSTIAPNGKFPDMKGLANYIHSLGLRFGIYSSPGPRTCGWFLGSYKNEDQDAKTYASWGVDYLKYDWCSYGGIAPQQPSIEDYQKPYRVMRAALDKNNRDILFSFCQYGMGNSWNWAGEIGGNSWRTTGDITDTWRSMSDIGFHQQAEAPHARPGHFNDPDMLIVGKVGWGDSQHNTRLTPDEQYTHISLWSLLSAPLLIGCDMGKLDRFTLNLLTNDEVLAINQDALGEEATEVFKNDHYIVYVKNMEDGSKAVGIFNITDQYQSINLNWADLNMSGYQKLRDVWRQKYIQTDHKTFTTGVPAHGVELLRLSR